MNSAAWWKPCAERVPSTDRPHIVPDLFFVLFPGRSILFTMNFIRIDGFKGKIYIPGDGISLKKHDCRDCFSCQNCSDERCAKCLSRGKSREAGGDTDIR